MMDHFQEIFHKSVSFATLSWTGANWIAQSVALIVIRFERKRKRTNPAVAVLYNAQTMDNFFTFYTLSSLSCE